MSYQVFARKYRPQTFDQVVGQEHITQTLKNAIEQNRLAHAYLFVGPRGIGKTSTARILAKALNCVQGPTAIPCNQCDSCKEITYGNNLDVLEIDGASNNGVEQVRELRENVQFAPTRGKFRIYIIDEVHMLTTAAFNALLKTLEEPPPHAKFIFATTEAQKVLPTILSRCQRFDLRRIPTTLIANHLRHIAASEKIDLSESAAHAVAKGADGGLRDAESMLDQLVAFCGATITEADVMAVFGFTAAETVANLTASILEQNTPEALALLRAEAESGKDLMRLLADLITHLRNVLVAQVDPGVLEHDFPADLRGAIQQQAENSDANRVLALIDQFAAAEGRMRWAPNKKLHFEIAIIRAVQSIAGATLDEVIEALNAVRDGGAAPAGARPELPKREPIKFQRVAAPASAPIQTPRSAPLPEAMEGPGAFSSPRQPATPPQPVPTPAPAPPPVAPPPAAKIPEPEPEPRLAAIPAPQPPSPAPKLPVEKKPAAAFEEMDSLLIEPIAPPPPLSGPELWHRLQKEIQASRPLILAWLQTGMFESYDGKRLTSAYPADGKIAVESLMRATNRAIIESTIASLVGHPVEFHTVVRENLVVEPPPENQFEPDTPEVDPMEELKNDPLIRKALESFKATEIDVS